MNQSGDLGRALFSAVVGAAKPREILSDLQKDAEELYKPRASKKVVNEAIAGYREAQARVKASILPVAEWKQLQKDLTEVLTDIKQVEGEIDGLGRDKSRLDRLRRVQGALAERRAVMARIEALGEVLLLPDDFDEKRKAARDKLQGAIENRARSEARLTRLGEEAAGLNFRQELLDNEEAILAIYKELGAVETAIKDRPGQDGKRRLLRNEAETLLKGVRPDLGLDETDQLRPLANNKKWITGLAQKHGLLAQKKEKAEAALRDARDELEGLRKELGEQEKSDLDLGELKATVAAARKEGDLEIRLARAQTRVADEKAACESELARLGRFGGTIEALTRTALPVSETLDTFERHFDEHNDKTKDHKRRHRELLEERQQAEQDLKALLLTGEVPTAEDLDKARAERDTGWGLIRTKYIEHKDVEREIAAYASDADLPDLYERRVEEADRISSQLISAQDRVVKRAGLEAGLESLTSRLKDNAGEIEAANRDGEKLNREWASIWEPLGITPGGPREMKQWLLRVDKLLANIRAAGDRSGEAANLDRDCKTLKESVARQIKKFDVSIKLEDMGLEAMLNLCEQRVEKEEAGLERKRHLERRQGEMENRLKRVGEELTAIESDWAAWGREWAQAIEGLGLKPDVHPEQAIGAFEQLMAFIDKYDRSEELRKRIFGIDQVSEKFQEKVFAFADDIGYAREGREATTIAAQLHRDLNQAREARASLRKIRLQEKEIEEDIGNTAISIKTAREQLAALRDQARGEIG